MLRVVSVLLKVIAWISLVASGLVAVLAVAFGSLLSSLGDGPAGRAVPFEGFGVAIGAVVIGLIYFLSFYAYGDIIAVLLKILDNTYTLLQRDRSPQS